MTVALRKKVLNFLNEYGPKVCVLATVSPEGAPHCAVMGYALGDDYPLILNTHRQTRKWRHLTKHGSVALTVGFDYFSLYLQLEGTARLVEQGPEHRRYEEIYFREHPDALEYRGIPETGTILIEPKWARLYDLSAKPSRFEEGSTAK